MGAAARLGHQELTLATFAGRGRPLSAAQSLRIAHHVAQSLRSAHERGWVHGSLTPWAVVQLASGRWEVMGYGQMATRPESHAYLAPDGWRQSQASAACDVWALGVILFQLLTGKLPFPNLERFDPGLCLLISTAPPVSQLCTVPMAVEALVARCLALDPSERPSAAELTEMLYRCREQVASGHAAMVAQAAVASAAPASVAQPLAPAPRRAPLFSPHVTQFAFLVVGVVLGLMLHGQIVTALCGAVVP